MVMFGIDLIELALRNLAVSESKFGKVGRSWWAVFNVEDQNDFSGTILHIHIATSEDWAELIRDVLDWASVAASVAGAVGAASALASGVMIPVFAVAWKVATNKDGTYDFFVIRESKPWVRKWHFLFYSTWIAFTGFVSDQWHKPPLSVNLANPLNLGKFSAVRGVAATFRESPRPN